MLEDHGQVPYIFLSFLLFFKLIFMFGKVKKKNYNMKILLIRET